jgi:hypothetical protein
MRRLERLQPWVHEYNSERTHTSLGGIPTEALVNNLRGITSSAAN